MFFQPQPQILHPVKGNRWGGLVVFTMVLAQQGALRLNAGLLGISRLLYSVALNKWAGVDVRLHTVF